MDPEKCPLLYSCSKVKMTPLIRTLLRCTASEAMKSICDNCVDALDTANKVTKTATPNDADQTYTSPSGHKITVVIGKENEPQDDNSAE